MGIFGRGRKSIFFHLVFPAPICLSFLCFFEFEIKMAFKMDCTGLSDCLQLGPFLAQSPYVVTVGSSKVLGSRNYLQMVSQGPKEGPKRKVLGRAFANMVAALGKFGKGRKSIFFLLVFPAPTFFKGPGRFWDPEIICK